MSLRDRFRSAVSSVRNAVSSVVETVTAPVTAVRTALAERSVSREVSGQVNSYISQPDQSSLGRVGEQVGLAYDALIGRRLNANQRRNISARAGRIAAEVASNGSFSSAEEYGREVRRQLGDELRLARGNINVDSSYQVSAEELDTYAAHASLVAQNSYEMLTPAMRAAAASRPPSPVAPTPAPRVAAAPASDPAALAAALAAPSPAQTQQPQNFALGALPTPTIGTGAGNSRSGGIV